LILNKIHSPSARLYYLRATAHFGWSRSVLLNQVKARAYERAVTEKKTHNFPAVLPEYIAEQAEETLKSSYCLEFLGIHREVKERELEDRLIERLQQFILELGYGFCFVGRQYRLALRQKEYFIDLLFYHRFLKALVAFELKVGPFEPEYAGKMDFYLNLLNDKERASDRVVNDLKPSASPREPALRSSDLQPREEPIFDRLQGIAGLDGIPDGINLGDQVSRARGEVIHGF
jgi:predicted nuclease of restriction endonuclease-like (RecB) superfamily